LINQIFKEIVPNAGQYKKKGRERNSSLLRQVEKMHEPASNAFIGMKKHLLFHCNYL
jgi:hypothetical protein